jgi:hypothetical protein
MKNMAEGKKLKNIPKQMETEIWKAHHEKREIKKYERKKKWKEKAKIKEYENGRNEINVEMLKNKKP